jgi:hypothetical protein
MKRRLAAAVAAFLTTAVHAQTIQLQIFPDKTLPGIPPSFAIHVQNAAPAQLTLLNGVNLEVTPQSGSRFFAEWDGRSTEPLTGDAATTVTIPANASRDFALPLDVTLATPAFFFDPRLSQPASYLLRVHLYQQVPNAANQDLQSGDVPFVVQTPAGEDAAVWNRMQQLANGKWSSRSWATYGFAVASEVFASHPSSLYLPYAALVKPSETNAQKLQAIDQALAMSPSGPIADMLRLGQAAVHGFMSQDAMREAQVDIAIAEEETARTITNDVAKRSAFAFLRARADAELKTLKTADELRAYQRFAIDHAPPAALALVPTAECVDIVGEKMFARFGYTNPNLAAKIIPAGKSNRVNGDGSNRGQPQYFRPGSHPHTFSASGDDDTVTWFLDGQTAAAGRNSARCAPVPDARPVRPFVDCVKQAGPNLFVHFGYYNPNAYAVVVANGADNGATPAPDSNPPTLFLAGVHHNAWSIKMKNTPSESWTLQGIRVTATPDNITKCDDAGGV